jgi:tRNA nucleotidyltransferase (CCA-adding enzyme)
MNADPIVLREQLQRALPTQVYAWLQQAISIAAAHNIPIYLVGGPVRDLLLGHPTIDLDLVMEGDAWPIAAQFAEQTGGKLTKHVAFRTATVELMFDTTSFALDFVTARREAYSEPAALPQVEPSGMHDDLFRRDFTINAVALRLDHDPALLDPFNGLLDLEKELVRVLHDQSFIDDPTRIGRGARFAARFAFAIEQHTRDLIAAALIQSMITRTSSQRILNEIWLLLNEPQPERALHVLHDLRALVQLGFMWNEAWLDQFPQLRALDLDNVMRRTIAWGLLVWPLDAAQRQALGKRYNLPGVERKVLRDLPFALPPTLNEANLDAVTLDDLLRGYDVPALHVLQLVTPPTAVANIRRYMDTIRSMPSLLTGADLRALGVPPGPRYKQILDQVRRAQLAGTITTVADARMWVTAQIATNES